MKRTIAENQAQQLARGNSQTINNQNINLAQSQFDSNQPGNLRG